uniref:Uncharacterized protein n=1 Tax=Ditylenchus dipsaci TaxID=166011 RepID=A0A915D567_9BILA
MDLLNIQDGTAASRPSLISSLWSLQVQLQNEPGTMNEDINATGSQQSLPEQLMMNSGDQSAEQMEFNYNSTAQQQSQTSFRSVKSLSDLNSLVMVPTTSAYQMSPLGDKELYKCLEDQGSVHNSGQLSSRLPKSSSVEQEQQHAMMGISRQQKNNNICQWLQKLDLNNASNTGSRDVLDFTQKICFNTDFFKK